MNTAKDRNTIKRSLVTGGMILAAFLTLSFAPQYAIRAVAPDLDVYTRWAIRSIIELAGSLVAVMALCRESVLGSIRTIRLSASFPKALGFALLVTLPMLLAFGLTSPTNEKADLLHFAFSSGVAPFVEEVLFRGLAFWMLYRYSGWNFWLAALIPALFFGYGHLYQAADLGSATGIFLITAVGSIWFSWLLLRWNNLWVPILVHALMNLWWDAFAVDETALGGWLANGARLAVIALSVIVTLYATASRPEIE